MRRLEDSFLRQSPESLTEGPRIRPSPHILQSTNAWTKRYASKPNVLKIPFVYTLFVLFATWETFGESQHLSTVSSWCFPQNIWVQLLLKSCHVLTHALSSTTVVFLMFLMSASLSAPDHNNVLLSDLSETCAVPNSTVASIMHQKTYHNNRPGTHSSIK